jgi:hypothetical protein
MGRVPTTEIVAEHNYWMPRDKALYLITALIETAAHILHGFTIGATYK